MENVRENVFLLKRSSLDVRFDPLYYKTVNNLDIANNTKYQVSKLTEVINMQRGRFGHRPRNDPRFYGGQYPFIQTGDIVKASNTGSKIEYSQTLNELGLKTSRLFDKDCLVITIAANIGDTAILDYPACFPDSLIAIFPKDESTLKLKYLNIYFKYLKNYLNDLAPQSAQKNINYQQLANIPIVIPEDNIQKKIINIHEQSIIKSQQMLSEAEELLDGINNYLLNELGIVLPQKDHSIENRVFTTQFSQLTGDRFDVFAILNKDFKIEGGKFKNKKLKNIAFLLKGKSITSDKIIKGEYPVIAGGQTSPYSHNEYNYEGNIITVSASGAYSGFVWYHTYPIFASDCTVLFSKDENEISTFFLSEILKTKQQEIYHLQQGAGQPHVYSRDLKELNVPIPPLQKQNEIANYITEIRKKAHLLRKESIEIVENMKKEIEKMIIG